MDKSTNKEEKMMRVTSTEFNENKPIPAKYTCDGVNVSPPLKLENVPENAKSLAVLVEDPDAQGKTWIHWIIFNITPKTPMIPENLIPLTGVQGINDFGDLKYDGPCPPSGEHRYYYRVYALDAILTLGVGSNLQEVLTEMQPHIIAEAFVMGKYKRP